MKILAILDVLSGAPMDRVRSELANELQGSWALFAAGVLREAYATAIPTRVVFVLETENAAHAEEHLRKLPLVGAGHINFELVELRPFVNWSKSRPRKSAQDDKWSFCLTMGTLCPANQERP